MCPKSPRRFWLHLSKLPCGRCRHPGAPSPVQPAPFLQEAVKIHPSLASDLNGQEWGKAFFFFAAPDLASFSACCSEARSLTGPQARSWKARTRLGGQGKGGDFSPSPPAPYCRHPWSRSGRTSCKCQHQARLAWQGGRPRRNTRLQTERKLCMLWGPPPLFSLAPLLFPHLRKPQD